MDQSNHTVTIPYQDYMDLLKFKEKSELTGEIMNKILPINPADASLKKYSFDDLRGIIKSLGYELDAVNHRIVVKERKI